MLNPGNLLLPALIFTAVGFIIGAVAAYFFLDRGKEHSEEEPAEKQAEKPAPKPAAEEPYTGLPLERFNPLVRLYREKSTGKLVTEIDRKIYLSRETVPLEQLHTLREAAATWNNWLGMEKGLPPAPEVKTAPPAAPLPDSSVLAAAVLPVDKPRATSIVGQIDEILQEMLVNSPFASRTIRLTQEANYGVIVWVDHERFNGIDAVPDAEIQTLIRAAVKKWEDTSHTLTR
ncbi:MAG: hypothetical protein ACK4SN_05965 [Bellilinea sp.]